MKRMRFSGQEMRCSFPRGAKAVMGRKKGGGTFLVASALQQQQQQTRPPFVLKQLQLGLCCRCISFCIPVLKIVCEVQQKSEKKRQKRLLLRYFKSFGNERVSVLTCVSLHSHGSFLFGNMGFMVYPRLRLVCKTTWGEKMGERQAFGIANTTYFLPHIFISSRATLEVLCWNFVKVLIGESLTRYPNIH